MTELWDLIKGQFIVWGCFGLGYLTALKFHGLL
jgi:hypothetical protein